MGLLHQEEVGRVNKQRREGDCAASEERWREDKGIFSLHFPLLSAGNAVLPFGKWEGREARERRRQRYGAHHGRESLPIKAYYFSSFSTLYYELRSQLICCNTERLYHNRSIYSSSQRDSRPPILCLFATAAAAVSPAPAFPDLGFRVKRRKPPPPSVSAAA